MTQFEKYCEIYHWVAKQYSKDTIERLTDLIELLRPTELDKLKAKFPEETAAVQMQ